jgi:hypothetical protein
VFLTNKQRIALQKAADRETASERQLALDELAVRLQLENPQAFHTNDSLHERCFYHAPNPGTPFFDFIIPFPKEQSKPARR